MRLSRPALAVAVGAVLLASGCGAAAGSTGDTPAPAPSSTKKPGEQHVRGTVTAENGSTWTITNAKNRPVTVTVTPQTAYGTKKAVATAAQFPVGSRVTVTGTRSGDTVTATRIAAPKPAPSA